MYPPIVQEKIDEADPWRALQSLRDLREERMERLGRLVGGGLGVCSCDLLREGHLGVQSTSGRCGRACGRLRRCKNAGIRPNDAGCVPSGENVGE